MGRNEDRKRDRWEGRGGGELEERCMRRKGREKIARKEERKTNAGIERRRRRKVRIYKIQRRNRGEGEGRRREERREEWTGMMEMDYRRRECVGGREYAERESKRKQEGERKEEGS